MKNKRKKRNITLRPGAVVYGILYVYAVIMTQLLRNPISNVFFWFMVTAAPLSFAFMMIGKAVIQVYVHSDVSATEKMAPVEYEIRIINQSPVPYPFVEAIVTQPDGGGVRCSWQNICLSLIPFGGYIVKEKINFRFRGLYEIGVKELYITDVLHIFRLRVEFNNYSNVTVSPRALIMQGAGNRSVSDIPTPTVRVIDNRDLSEINNIREYRNGDSLKAVHWKLSTKSEELQVKEFSTNNDRHTYIFADMSAPTPPPEIEKEEARVKLRRAVREARRKKALKGTGTFISGFFASLGEKRKKKKYLKNRARGINAGQMEAAEMIDRLIRETSAAGKKEKKKAKKEPEHDVMETVEALEKIIGEDTEKATRSELEEAQRRWGGVPKGEFADEMPEYCADGVAEITVAAAAKELRCGNLCTVIWFGRDGVESLELCDSADFDELCRRFASTPVVAKENRIGRLTDAIGEAANVTVKIVTANIDPVNLADYCAVPAAFGGAGCGCVTEVLLFDPWERYVSPVERQEYAADCKMRLRHAGADLYGLRETVSPDGASVLQSDELI